MLISDWSSDLCSSDLNNVGDALSALDNAINQIDIPEPPPGGAEPDPLVQVDGTRDGSDDAQVVDGSRGVAIGSSASAGGENAVAVGGNSFAAGPNDTAIGGNARVNADGSTAVGADRKSVVQGKRVSVRVDLGGRRIIKKRKK